MYKLILILVLGLVSCVEPGVSYPASNQTVLVDSVTQDTLNYPLDLEIPFIDTKLKVVLIDGCEYLYGPWGNATVLTHKGNCKNIPHR